MKIMSYDIAEQLAEKHLVSIETPGPDYEWKLEGGTSSSKGWVFEYSVVCKKNIPPEDWEAFAGAPAFLVSEDGIIRDLTWQEFSAIVDQP